MLVGYHVFAIFWGGANHDYRVNSIVLQVLLLADITHCGGSYFYKLELMLFKCTIQG